MDPQALTQYILETYNAQQDYPWAKYPTYCVFRHPSNKKWFALMAEVPSSALGRSGMGTVPIINLKCGSPLVATLVEEPGFFPAYHMNKNHWISIALDGTAPADKIKFLVELSFDLTAPKGKKPPRQD